jgi:hypothetical protein
MSVVPFKDPFRVFSRETARAMMQKLDVNAEALSGSVRGKEYYLFFDTFDTLADGVSYFAEAMTTELEHGSAATPVDGNVTNDDPLKTAMIVVSHLCGIEYGEQFRKCYQFSPYYDALWWIEGMNSMWNQKKSKQ